MQVSLSFFFVYVRQSLTLRDSLLGYASLVISDRILGLDYVERIRPRFEKALEEEFTDRDGTMVPIRSELTGMTVRFQFQNTKTVH